MRERTDRGLWSQPGVPHKGWTCLGINDAGEDNLQTCEMCQFAQVRYLHVMEHQDFDRQLQVGCICAGKMEEDYAGARRREKRMKSKVARRKKWLTRKWRVSAKGNSYLKVSGSLVVVYSSKFGQFSFSVDGARASRWFQREEEAKLASFEAWWDKLNSEPIGGASATDSPD
jgi:hypothetical protein